MLYERLTKMKKFNEPASEHMLIKFLYYLYLYITGIQSKITFANTYSLNAPQQVYLLAIHFIIINQYSTPTYPLSFRFETTLKLHPSVKSQNDGRRLAAVIQVCRSQKAFLSFVLFRGKSR